MKKKDPPLISGGAISHRGALASAVGLLALPKLALGADLLRPRKRCRSAMDGWGAMVFGQVGQDRLQLNEDMLWAGGPYTPDNPQALAALPEVLRLIAEGRYKEASELAKDRTMASPLWQMSYGSLGDIMLNFPEASALTCYERELDPETAISRTAFSNARGEFSCEAFVSAPEQVKRLKRGADRCGS